MNKVSNILILGGTRNARDLAIMLAQYPRLNVVTSLAGRTQEPDRTFGKTRVGGFGGVPGLWQYMQQNDIRLLVDSTHPFAVQISKNAQQACENTKIPRLVLDRPKWEKKPGDNWIACRDIDEAASNIPPGALAFLALGHQYLGRFSHRGDVKFIARLIDKPAHPIPLKAHQLVIAKPSHIVQEEEDLFTQHQITHLVCRNSGGTLIYAKIEAARNLQLPILMIDRPPKITGNTFENIEQIANQIIRILP